MTIYLREEHVRELLTMPETIAALEQAFRDQATGAAAVYPRTRLRAGGAALQLMPAVVPGLGGMGYKTYATSAGTRAKALVTYYDTTTGHLGAIIEANRLGQMRTGAASGVATKYQARPDAQTVGIIGTGYQARTQLAAVCAVRDIRRVQAFSRNPEHRTFFAEQMSKELGVEVVPVNSAQEAVQGSAIVVVITNSSQPVLSGEWLAPGQHINAAGGNALIRRELDEEAVRRASLITVDDREQARLECADLWQAVERGLLNWEQTVELADVVAGRIPGRASPQDITLFESQGIGLWDIAAAAVVYRKALERGLGDTLPF
ncbi:MAG: ornithine cyclodeaminase family protein [Chloroflexi bacterium]|nr:ornithine cyclodeaminase family protein [Chloroflexota bacterium]